MNAAERELRDQPSVDGAAGELAALGALARPGNIFEEPGDLGAGEIGVGHETRLLAQRAVKAFAPDAVAHGGGAAALPDDGVIGRLAGRAVPQQDGLALVGDADGGDVLETRASGGQGPLRDRQL